MTTNNELNAAMFHADIENRTRDLTARIAAAREMPVQHVHPFVYVVAENIVTLIGYSSDSMLDEYIANVEPYLSIDAAEEFAACNYPNDVCTRPESAEYRAFATEVDSYVAVANHLSDAERELLNIDILALSDEYDERDEWRAALLDVFNRIMTFAHA